ncbi:MAG: SPFH domain-containing protein [Verrucomicrobiota bacterium]|nr:SPFH domain-containing protein [Verrucomicrobiota bacterium]
MGFFDKLRGELIDIIEWEDMEDELLVHRFERHGNEIKMGAKLVVRPGQRAVFVNEGQVADEFEPGTFTLETKNIPILTTLKGWKYGFHSPFKAEVYFIKTTEQLDRKWGTPNPVMMRDNDFGMVRLRSRGNYSYKISIKKEMITRFVGAQKDFSLDDIEGQIRTKVISSFSDAIGEAKIPALELAANYDELSNFMIAKLNEEFVKLGLELLVFTLENISLPQEVEKAMDQRSSMGALGNLNNFAQYQAANAIRDAAQNEGGTGNMMGMMMGSQMAGGVSNTLHQPQQQGVQQSSSPQQQPAAPPPIPSEPAYFVAVNGTQTGPFKVVEFKNKVNAGEFSKDSLVWKEGMSAWTKAGEVSDLAAVFNSTPPPIPPPIPGS